MSTLLITYNLNKGDDNYEELFKAIRALGDTWHDARALDSVWFLKTDLTPNAVHQRLRPAFDKNDNWFIVDITGAALQGWTPEGLGVWLKR